MSVISISQEDFKRQYVNNLLAAGMPKPQAEALAKEQSQLLKQQVEQLATKADLILLEEKIEKRLVKLQLNMTILIGGGLTTSVGILLAALRFMH